MGLKEKGRKGKRRERNGSKGKTTQGMEGDRKGRKEIRRGETARKNMERKEEEGSPRILRRERGKGIKRKPKRKELKRTKPAY